MVHHKGAGILCKLRQGSRPRGVLAQMAGQQRKTHEHQMSWLISCTMLAIMSSSPTCVRHAIICTAEEAGATSPNCLSVADTYKEDDNALRDHTEASCWSHKAICRTGHDGC